MDTSTQLRDAIVSIVSRDCYRENCETEVARLRARNRKACVVIHESRCLSVLGKGYTSRGPHGSVRASIAHYSPQDNIFIVDQKEQSETMKTCQQQAIPKY